MTSPFTLMKGDYCTGLTRSRIIRWLRVQDQYFDVVCYFDENLPASVAYAYRCEDDLPATWDD